MGINSEIYLIGLAVLFFLIIVFLFIRKVSNAGELKVKIESIPDKWGTAVNVQSMVFGNLGQNSATGVAFTRNPSTGINEIYGEYLINAQGEDVVAGTRTPNYLSLIHI